MSILSHNVKFFNKKKKRRKSVLVFLLGKKKRWMNAAVVTTYIVVVIRKGEYIYIYRINEDFWRNLFFHLFVLDDGRRYGGKWTNIAYRENLGFGTKNVIKLTWLEFRCVAL